MLSRLANIFRVPDLRNKVVFTLAIIALYQIGANVPVPGVNWARAAGAREPASASGVLGFLNLFSGGALVRLAVFGLGVMPYITSSIIIQLLSTVIPKLEEWRDQGAVGQKKITQTTRYLTVALAVMQSSGPRLRLPRPRLGPAGHERRPDPDLQLAAGPLHGADPHGGHGLRHVAGRAHHPARHRPGHVDPDLRQRGGGHPHRFQGHLRGGWQGQVHDHHHRLARPAWSSSSSWTRASAASRDLRPPGGGAADVRRQLHLHPAEGEPVRRDPDHLRQLGALHPGPALQRRPVELVPELRAQQPDADQLLLHRWPTSCSS